MKLDLKTWHRKTIAVHLGRHMDRPERAELVTALVSGPFAIYQGTAWSAGHTSAGRKSYVLLHLPSQSPNLTLPRMGLCRQAALELAECALDWSNGWGPDVTGPDLAKAGEIHRRWMSWGKRKSWGRRP